MSARYGLGAYPESAARSEPDARYGLNSPYDSDDHNISEGHTGIRNYPGSDDSYASDDSHRSVPHPGPRVDLESEAHGRCETTYDSDDSSESDASRDSDASDARRRLFRQKYAEQIQRELSGANDPCSVCTTLCLCIANTGSYEEITYDFNLSVEEILQMGCPDHHMLFQRLKDHILTNNLDPRWISGRLGIMSDVELIDFEIRHDISGFYDISDFHLGVVKREDIPNHPSPWRQVKSSWDIETIHDWDRFCTTHHGKFCLNPWSIQQIRPAWLIDTIESCLVPGENFGPYICLSYRWGTRKYQTLKDSLADLQNPGYFNRPEIQNNLPLVISDAMQLVRKLGKRYLWADTICIAQDDKQSMETEMGRMGDIYGSAWLVIVATDGDGDFGLPGVTQPASGRLVQQQIISFGMEKLLFFPDIPYQDVIRGTQYGSRAWTFQENKMACRTLTFANNRIHWNCSGPERGEERDVFETECFEYPPSRTAWGVPDLRYYGFLTGADPFETGYNERELAYDSDALDAISGMLTVLSRGFHGGFLWGLPVMFFDLALCWRPRTGYQRRRVALCQEPGSDKNLLPSWSWIGWQGAALCCEHEAGFHPSHGRPVSQTFPITAWYAHRTPHGPEQFPISSWFRGRASHCDPDRLPPGWTRHAFHTRPPESMPTRPEGCMNFVFSHKRFQSYTFWYHFPIPETFSDTGSKSPPQMPYILGRTTRAWLETYYDDKSAFDPFDDRIEPHEKPRPNTFLRDHDGNSVGGLWLHSAADYSRLPATADGTGTKVELVAICRRVFLGEPKEYQYKDYYAVLWIQWKNGVAYRQASGLVERSAWETHPDLEEVELVLG